MELTRPGYAIVYVILLCALALGGSEGKRGKDEDFSSDDKQVENVWKHCRKELIGRDNDVKDFDLHPLEWSSDMRSILTTESNMHKETKSLPPHIKERILYCISTPPAPASVEKDGSRFLLTKHSEPTFGLRSGHERSLIAESPHNEMSPRPATVPSPLESPSHEPTQKSSPSSPTPDSSPSSPTPDPHAVDLPLPPDMFVPFPPPPPPPLPHAHTRENFRPLVYAPTPSPPNKDDKKQKTIILASTISGIIILIGLSLCYREVRSNKLDKDDRPLLILSSSDYPRGSQKVTRLGSSNREEFGINNGKKHSNVRNWSIKKAEDNNNSKVETTSSEGKGQIPAPPSGRPAPPPPGPPPPPPPALAPRPPPPPRGAHPPPAPPHKPMAGRNQHTPLGPLRAKEGSSGEGDAQKPKLKPFFWDKVSAKPDQSMVWHEINAGSFQFNEEMMESLFGCTNQNRNERKKDSPSVDTSVHYIQIIDPKKAQNLSILLRALNVTTEEVVDALKEGNEIPIELIQTLLKMAPTAEEELKLRLFTGELSQLGPAERFLKILVDIPFAFKRLESLMFMFILQEETSSIKDSFATLEVACNKLRKSRLFSKLLEAVLKTGNRMNDGTYRGGAQAFRLDTLLKLSDVKGTDGKTTLLHFVVQEIIRSEGIRAVRTERASRSISSSVATEDFEDGSEESAEHYRSLGLQVVSGLSTELGDVKKAALIDGDALSAAVSKLGYSLIKAQEFLNTDMKNLEEDSEFQRCLERFVEKAKEDVTWLVEEEKRIMALVKSTADYFHGNAGKDEGLRLFLTVRDFLIILDKVCKEVKDTTIKSSAKVLSCKKEAPSVSSSPDTRQHSPPSDLHRKLFPAIAERRVDYPSSDDDDGDFSP